jgi:biotin carboxyl carrier protein
MELVLSAPRDCVVHQWFVAGGDAVCEGQVGAHAHQKMMLL